MLVVCCWSLRQFKDVSTVVLARCLLLIFSSVQGCKYHLPYSMFVAGLLASSRAYAPSFLFLCVAGNFASSMMRVPSSLFYVSYWYLRQFKDVNTIVIVCCLYLRQFKDVSTAVLARCLLLVSSSVQGCKYRRPCSLFVVGIFVSSIM